MTRPLGPQDRRAARDRWLDHRRHSELLERRREAGLHAWRPLHRSVETPRAAQVAMGTLSIIWIIALAIAWGLR